MLIRSPRLARRTIRSPIFESFRALLLDFDAARASVSGALPAPLIFSRAQTNDARAIAVGADGVTWGQFGADVPRFSGPARRLLQEGQETNRVRTIFPTSYTAGAVTNGLWSVQSTAGGITIAPPVSGIENGIGYVDIGVSGTATSAGQVQISPLISTQSAPALAGEIWTASVHARVAAGVLPGPMNCVMLTRDASFVLVTPLPNAPTVLPSGTAAGGHLGAGVLSTTRTLNVTTPATAFLNFRYDVGIPNGATIDFVLRIGGARLSRVGFATTPPVPAAGTFGPVTRGDDIITAPLSALRIPQTGACSFLWRGLIAGLAGFPLTIFGVDDDTTASRIELRVSGTGIPQVARATGGVFTLANIGSTPIAPGALLSGIITIDGAGRAFAAFAGLNGGVGAEVTGAPTSGLTTLRIGRSVVGAPFAGEHEKFRLGRPLSDAAAQARVAAY